MHDVLPPAPAGPAPTRVNRLFLLSFLTVFAIVDSTHDYVSRLGEGRPVDAGAEVLGGLLFWGPLLAFTLPVLWLAESRPVDFERPGSLVLHFSGGLIFTYLHVMVQAIPGPPYAPAGLSFWARFFFQLKGDFALDYLFYCVIVGTAYLLHQAADLRENQRRASQLEIGLAETRLRAIQGQLNPHFFFNTLQAISVMALTGERDGVVQMLGRLSALLRVSFDKNRPPQIALADELGFIDSFLSIHTLSFGERLSVERDIEPATLHAAVPTMLLQPLVENAIVHGVAIKPGKGTVRIRSRRVGEHLLIEVDDSGPGFAAPDPGRRGVGLSVTESRLELLYGPRQHIEYGRSELGGAHVSVQIPFRI